MARLPRPLTLALLALAVACGKSKVDSKPVTATNERPAGSSSSSGAGGSSSSGSASSSASGSASGSASSGSASSSGAGSTGATGSTSSSGDVATPDLSSCMPVGSVLQSTTNVNLRQGPGTSYSVIVVVSQGSQVTTINQETPENGFYNVSFGGVQGWTYADYYVVVSVPSGGTCTASSGSSSSGSTSSSSSSSSSGSTGSASMRDTAVQRAQDAMGFSYWWGHGRFLPTGPTSSTAGSCSGSCPSCTHSGSYGGDCSGMVGKAWLLGNQDLTVDGHPYSTYDFVNSAVAWHDVDRGSVQRGDALVYNSNGAGHIFLYESGDGWGSMWAYECKGCSAGCVHDLRTAGSAYKGIAHNGW